MKAAPDAGVKPIPMLDLRRQYESIREDVLASIERVCASQQFVLGTEVEELETAIAELVGAHYAVGCASGTDALWLALAAAGVGPGDQVITTAFSFFASASSIVRAGAEPVFADVDSETLNLDPKRVRAILDSGGRKPAGSAGRIKAILPVHLYGQCADMESFERFAGEHGLVLIEDAAQAIGARWRGGKAGSMGKAAAFSFYPTKNLSAYGDAGMVTTSDPSIAEHMRRLRNHGSPERYLHTQLGWNARMDAIQAAVLRVKLRHVELWNQRRREHAETYDRLLEVAGLCEFKVAAGANSATRHKAAKATSTPVERVRTSPQAFHVFHQYAIRVKRRDELRRHLAERGIASEVYYPIPLHLQPAFAYLGYRRGDLPESERAAEETLALPMFPELTEEEQSRVVAAIGDFFG
jgi:dTDP-4-amino-4,6-dideoxygalactose transaminase